MAWRKGIFTQGTPHKDAATANGGVGLLGMKEGAEQIGAALTISSEPGKGRGARSIIVHSKERNR